MAIVQREYVALVPSSQKGNVTNNSNVMSDVLNLNRPVSLSKNLLQKPVWR